MEQFRHPFWACPDYTTKDTDTVDTLTSLEPQSRFGDKLDEN